MCFEGIRSERQLVDLASLTLAHRWYLGYHLDESLPDRSSLVKIRQRLGLPVFRRFFEHVVDLCADAGLIWGKEVLADATRVPGNASTDSLVPRLKEIVDHHLVELFDTLPGSCVAADDPPHEPVRWDLLETCRRDPRRPPSGPYRRSSDRKISHTAPDAAAMSMRDGRTVLGYQNHYLADGGTARSILHAFVTPGDVAEHTVLLDHLYRTMFRRTLHPRRVIADATDATTSNIRTLEDAGIRAFVPLPEWDTSSTRYKRAAFIYDPVENIYRCPQGESLRLRWTDRKGEQWLYRARATACNGCVVKGQCTTSKQGRLIRRSFHEAYRERVRAYAATPAFTRAMRKRSTWVEGRFAEAKQWHGLHRFRLRGLVNVNIQALIVATGQNLKRWLGATGWGRRSFPGAACTPNGQYGVAIQMW
jgi:IS5 family transposase